VAGPALAGQHDDRVPHDAGVQRLPGQQPLFGHRERGVLLDADDVAAAGVDDPVEQGAVGVPAVADVAPAGLQGPPQHPVLAGRPAVAGPGPLDPPRAERVEVELGVQPPPVHGPAVPGGGVAGLPGVAHGGPGQPRQGRQDRAVDHRQDVLELRQPRVFAQRPQLRGQFGDDRLQPGRVERPHRLGEAAQREPPHAQRRGHPRQGRRVLQRAERVDQRVEQVQQDELAVAVEEQRAVAGPVPVAPHVAEPVQQRR
jgi:hypothetical protein